MKKMTLSTRVIIMTGIILISLIIYKNVQSYDHDFYIPGCNIHIFTKKKWGGKFIIMFAEDKKNIRYNKDIDYVETETGAYIRLIFDQKKPKTIIVNNENKASKINQVKYNIKYIDWQDKRKYHEMIDTIYINNQLRSISFYDMRIDSKEYYITLNNKVLSK